jgi:hypothetical protein
MSDEVHDWLTDMRDSDPLIAGYIVQALAALMKQGAGLADPLVASTEDAWPSALADELDRRYAQMLENLQPVRRLAAESGDAATQERLIRLNARADAFRARKEVLKARYVAAHSALMIYQSIDVAGLAGDDAEPASRTDASSLRDVIAEMERELGRQAWPDGLMELRPGAPGNIGVRVLFAIEPPGTALLLSVLEGSEAVEDHLGQAIVLSADILRRVRAGQEPEAATRGYSDVRLFLEEFQPGGF